MNVLHGPMLSDSQNKERNLRGGCLPVLHREEGFWKQALNSVRLLLHRSLFSGYWLMQRPRPHTLLQQTWEHKCPSNERHSYQIEHCIGDRGTWPTSGALCSSGFIQTLHKRSSFNCVFLNQCNPNLISLYWVFERNCRGPRRSFSIKWFFKSFPLFLCSWLGLTHQINCKLLKGRKCSIRQYFFLFLGHKIIAGHAMCSLRIRFWWW